MIHLGPRCVMLRLTLYGGLMLLCRLSLAADYDPLKLPAGDQPKTIELTVRDEARNRQLPLLVYLPAAGEPRPVVLFSHGLGGTRQGCEYLGRHWAARGYVAVFLQHPGSDDAVWKDAPPLRRMAAMREAASADNFRLRVQDVPAVLDQLENWNSQADHALHGRCDPRRVGMSGHSFGAVTTQAVSGQAAPLIGQRFTDGRIRAAIAFSPSSPRRGNAATAFGSVKIPWLLMTGTKDLSVIGDADLESRLNVYPNLPRTIDKYELVLHNAEHSAFTDRALPGDTEQRNPNHHRVILALSTAFWDTYLLDDSAARAWLHGSAPRELMEADDRWQLHAGGAAAGSQPKE